MAKPQALLVLAILARANTLPLNEVGAKLALGLNFVHEHHRDFNFDGLLGVILAEAQLVMAKASAPAAFAPILDDLIASCERIAMEIKTALPPLPENYRLFAMVLLRPEFWATEAIAFKEDSLLNLGVYENWTAGTVMDNRKAEFRGIGTDFCLEEILTTCDVGQICGQMMFAPRTDEGYLLSHRLLYITIGLNAGCFRRTESLQSMIEGFCSLMLKEAKTNGLLGFPKHDIFLEQMAFCGMQGFSEFLTELTLRQLLDWQSPEGCYRSQGNGNVIQSRTANLIAFNCTDHATGLGIAALALHFRKQLTVLSNQ